jgi:glycosyltransferase involved in cell wall biosynthesis
MKAWPQVSLIVPFYRNVQMLKRQLQEWESYPENISIILVDDGSPEPAEDVVRGASGALSERLRLLRIDTDISWNRGGARNLGATVADTDWIVHIDIDHLLPRECAKALATVTPDPAKWYRFPRFRRGAADETRKKDAIDPAMTYGPIKPHLDSYLVTREMYWKAGAYNEGFSGCLGGGSPFIAELGKVGEVDLLPQDVFLEVYTRTECGDASDFTLSRDTSEFTRRKRLMNGNYKGREPYLRFPWHEVNL